MKRKISRQARRALCLLLALLTAGSILLQPSTSTVSAEQWEAVDLGGARLEDIPEGNYLYFGTAAVQVEESDTAFRIPVYREGDLSGEATVELHSLDLSALYGEDYVLVMPDLEERGSEKTILEQYLGDQDSYEAAVNSEAGADYYLIGDIASEETTEADNTADESEKSALAALKQSETGEETRELYATEYQDELAAYLEALVPQVTSELECSSKATLTFAPGESEKDIIFRILDDDRSEGTETFSLQLCQPEGAELYEVWTLSVSINDDEPQVRSAVSFDQASYTSKDGEVTVRLCRENADYSLVDLTLLTSGDTAVAGENYQEINETVAFAPYEMEKEITIPVCGEGSFSLLLRDFTACEAGECTEAVIHIQPTGETLEAGRARVLREASTDSSFSLSIGGKSYTVAYNKGEATGKIMDYSYSPAVEVGVYYFALPTTSNGIFNYGTNLIDGDKPSGWGKDLVSRYQAKNYQHDSYGELEWYSSDWWEEGKVRAESEAVVPTAYYQYFAPYWEAPDDSGKGQIYVFNLSTPGGACIGATFVDTIQWGRTTDNAVLAMLDWSGNAFDRADGSFVFGAGDQDNWGCPDSYLKFYGVACMYRKYRVSTNVPAMMNYRNGEGGWSSKYPVDFNLSGGVQTGNTSQWDYYVNLEDNKSITFNLNYVEVNSMVSKFGTLSGYTITIDPGTSDQRTTLHYPDDFEAWLRSRVGTTGTTADYSSSAVEKRINLLIGENATLATVPCDIYFMDWIKENQKSVIRDGNGFYQRLIFTPLFQYDKCTVKVLAPVDGLNGTFTTQFPGDEDQPGGLLEAGKTYSFHAGDVLDLSVETKETSYRVGGYAYSTNGGEGWTYVEASKSTTLGLNPEEGTEYLIRPFLVQTDNRIEIRYDTSIPFEGIKNALTIYGVNHQKLIPAATLNAAQIEGNILMLNPEGKNVAEQMAPVPGQVYRIEIGIGKLARTTYYPVVTDAYGNKYYGSTLYYTAKSNKEDNILTIDFAGDSEDSNMHFEEYTIKGRLVSECKPILATGTKTVRLGVSGYTVTTGTNLQLDNATGIDSDDVYFGSASAITDENGYFTLTGVKLIHYTDQAADTTLLVSNGAVDQVITLHYDTTTATENVLDVGDIIYDMDTAEQQVIDAGEITIDYPSQAPRVVSLSYHYDKPANDQDNGTLNNTVTVYDDALTVDITVDDKGMDVTKAIFTLRTPNGQTSTRKVSPNENNPGTFSLRLEDMTGTLYDGEQLWVALVSEANGREYTYPTVDTGILFKTKSVQIVEQWFETETTPSVTIPFMGALSAKSSSGLLSFSRTNWSDNAGYTLSLNLDLLYSEKGTLSSDDKLQKANQLSSLAQEANKKRKIAAEANALTEKERLLYSATTLFKRADSDESGWSEDELMEYWDIQDQIKHNESLLNDVKEGKKAVSEFGNNAVMQGDILGLLSFDFVLDPEKGEYVFSSGAVSMGGSFSFNKTTYYVFYGIPVYLNFTGFLQSDLVCYYSTEDGQDLAATVFSSYEGNIVDKLGGVSVYLDMAGSLKIGFGVGMSGVADFECNGKFEFNFSVPLLLPGDWESYPDKWGLLAQVTGGISGDLIIMHVDVPLATGTLGFGTYEGQSSLSFLGGFTDSLVIIGQKAAAGESVQYSTAHLENYDAGTADLSLFGSTADLRATPEAVSKTTLLDSAAERTAPQILTLENGEKMVLFLGNRGGESALNQQALYWSVCKDGAWSTPQLVSDDGTVDAKPTVLQKNGKVVVAWVNADHAYTEEETAIEKLNALGISLAVYDSVTDTWSRAVTMESDAFFNFAPQLNIADDVVYCSYMKRDISNVKDELGLLDYTNTYSTMAYLAYDLESGRFLTTEAADGTQTKEHFISIEHPTLTDPLVLDYQCVTMQLGGTNWMLATYTVDEDEDLTTGTDRELFLSITDLDSGKSYYPIQLTDDAVNQSSPKLTELNGTVYLTWLEEGYLVSLLDVSTLVKELFCPETLLSEEHLGDEYDSYYQKALKIGEVYRTATGSDWYRKTAQELELDAELYGSSVYNKAAQGSFDAVKSNLHQGAVQTGIANYTLAADGEDIYLFYTDYDSINPDDYSIELFGARYQGNSGFDKSVQITNFGRTIDEFDLSMNEAGEISVVSNFYRKWIDEESGAVCKSKNQLVEINFEPAGSVCVVDDELVLPDYLVGGNCENLSFRVENDGLMPAEGFHVKLTQTTSEGESLIYEGDYDTVLNSGQSCEVVLPWSIPENPAGTSLKLEVTESGVELERTDTVVKEIPAGSDLVLSGTQAQYENGQCILNATVTNRGAEASEPACAQVCLDTEEEPVLGSIELPALASGETRQISVPFTPDVEDFTSVGVLELKLHLYENGENQATSYTRTAPGKPVVAQINGGVTELTLAGGTRQALTTQAAPWNEVAGELHYVSSDPSVVSVDQNGMLTAGKRGKATVTAYYACGVKASVEVTVTDAANATFSDVAQDSVYADAIAWAAALGIAQGSTATTFSPDEACTRAQAVTFLWRLAGCPVASGEMPFADVKPGDYFCEAVRWAVEKGIAQGEDATHFAPDEPCTRAQILTFLWRAAGSPEVTAELPFADVRPDDYFYQAVVWALSKDITTGEDATHFAPDEPCTRAQLVTFLWRAAKSPTPNGKMPFADVSTLDYFYDAVRWAVWYGVTTGEDATHFAPDASCTRAQAVTLLWRAAGSPEASGELSFADVKPGDYFYDAVCWAVEAGITQGEDAAHFAPDAPCTRAQIVTLLWRAAGSPEASARLPFADVKPEDYFSDAVAWAAERGITTGEDAAHFAPDEPCTRAQIITFLWRLMN